jgi:hypothetical protein
MLVIFFRLSRRLSFRRRLFYWIVCFGCFPGAGRLGAFAVLVVIAKSAGVRLLASLTEFCSHFTPLLITLNACSFLLERFQVSGDVSSLT